jgi:hypothetical protein
MDRRARERGANIHFVMPFPALWDAHLGVILLILVHDPSSLVVSRAFFP